MKLYMLSPDSEDVIVKILGEYERMWIPRESYLWVYYEEWLAEGNEPEPWTPIIFPRSSDVE